MAIGVVLAALLVYGLGQEILKLSGVSGRKPVGKLSAPVTVNFPYLVPAGDAAWLSEDDKKQTDPTKGVITYPLTFLQNNTQVIVSQQQLPADLQPLDSDKFKAFIKDQNPVRDQEIGDGKLYFLPAMQNGQPANGASTVIYATSDILLFARANEIVDWKDWAKLMAAMSPN